MSHDATVNAGDIARLADVGRAAVSNWRRRYEDFPQPVGGTASSPLFSLPEIEEWLRANGKAFEVSLGDRVWQGLRAAVDDLRLGELAGFAGAFLLYVLRDPDGWRRLAARSDLVVRLSSEVAAATADLPIRPGSALEDARLVRLIADLSALHGPTTAFEFICERYVEAHTRRLAVTRAEVAALMGRLAWQACPEGGSVLDPAVGVGTLLLAVSDAAAALGGTVPRADRRAGAMEIAGAVPPIRLLGQEINETAALLASLRLLLRGANTRIVAGDSLRRDGFAGERADVVLCDPPFNERAWGHEELIGDPRWDYGVPPRGEPELAWVQHCLAHVRPGGLVAILMPAAAAARRPGRRIRANLLRAGALRAVITLSAAGPDLWLLRRPETGERSPTSILLADASDDLSIVEPAWRTFAEALTGTAAGGGLAGTVAGAGALPRAARIVRIIDLLDDEVDVSPARHLSPRSDPRRYPAAGRRLRDLTEAMAEAAATLPDLEVLSKRADLPATAITDLVKAGMVAVRHSVLKAADAGDLSVLTADDLARGGPPSGRTTSVPGLVTVTAGDIVASATTARVIGQSGAVLGPQLSLYRVDLSRLDPEFLTGFLKYAAARGHPGASRVDIRRARIPRLPLVEQQAYGLVFQRLAALEDAIREAAEAGDALIRLGLEGLVDGRLRPRV